MRATEIAIGYALPPDIENRRKRMGPLKYLVVITAIAAAPMVAQNPKTPPAPADPGASNRSQADRTTTTSSASDSRTWTGTIVNANCSQASNLPSAGSYADRTGSTSTASTSSTSSKSTAAGANDTSTSSKTKGTNDKSVYDLESEVLKRCPADNTITAFAVLT